MRDDRATLKKVVNRIKQAVANNADCDVVQEIITAVGDLVDNHAASKHTLFLALASLVRTIAPDDPEAQFVWVTAFASFVSDIEVEREPIATAASETPVVLQ